MGCSEKTLPTKPTDVFVKVPYDTSVVGLPDADTTRILDVADGDTLRLSVSWVAKNFSGHKVRMLAYNGSIPGPTIRVAEGASITVLLVNQTNLPTSLHSHGVRLDYKYDGIPGITATADSGKTVVYQIHFPDPGLFWYHPHYREDYQMELGLAGTYLVVPKDSSYWPPVNREIVLVLDDILLDEKSTHPFYQNVSDYALMGRFGNVLLINGDPHFELHVKRNETIRFYTVNASNTRVYNLQFSRDMDMNIIGADNGRFEFPGAKESYVIAPSERVIFQLGFNDGLDDYSPLELLNATPSGTAVIGKIFYDPDTITTDLRSSLVLVQCAAVTKSLDPFRKSLDKLPDEQILLTGYMDMSKPLAKLSAVQHDPDPGNTMGIEWNDSVHGASMVLMNQQSSNRNVHWAIRDLKTGLENHEINWNFQRGSQVMIRIHNDTVTTPAPGTPEAAMSGMLMYHPMPHPIHFHGQRFLVVRENGKVPAEGLVWRDSYLIGRGYTVDVLLDASNPGHWMFHCHIAEHFEADMMGHFSVSDTVVGAKMPYPWSLNLNIESSYDSLRRDTVVMLGKVTAITGKVNHFDPAVLEANLFLSQPNTPALHLMVPLAPNGAFTLATADLLGAGTGLIPIHAVVKSKALTLRPSPDTLRLIFDARIELPWSLDLDMAGDAAFQALVRDTVAVSGMRGTIAGKVNGYDLSTFSDSIYFRNVLYPNFMATKPLASDGTFSFDAFEIVGALDGLQPLKIFLKFKSSDRRLAPDTLRINLSVP